VQAVARYLDDTSATVEGAVIAVAGPVIDGVGRLTNVALEFSGVELARRLPLGRAVVINDFSAVGPGTGLGMGALMPLEHAWRVLPSEGGHGDLAATDPLEAELVSTLGARSNGAPVTWESVLSGPGLVNLYNAMCDVWGCAATHRQAVQISRAAVADDDPVSHQTLDVFCRLLGGAAANLALTLCAEGGVYLAGGIVPQLVDFIAASRFRHRFDDRGPMSDYAKRIATVAILEPQVGLLGAARAFTGEWVAGGLQVPRDSKRAVR
jgi:glucokinase